MLYYYNNYNINFLFSQVNYTAGINLAQETAQQLYCISYNLPATTGI